MGATEKAIPNDGPVGQFAQRLRDRRIAAGKPSYRAMADRCHYSHSVLAAAAAGHTLQSWEVTREFLKACGAKEQELARWQKYWCETNQVVENLAVAAMVHRIARSAAGEAISPNRGRLAAPTVPIVTEQPAPDPDAAHTFEDIRHELEVLRILAGKPPLRDLAAGARWSTGTLSGLFTGRRHPKLALLLEVVYALYDHMNGYDLPPHQRREMISPDDLMRWRAAWGRAKFNAERPDLRRRPRGEVVLQIKDQQSGPAGAIVAELPPELAADMLRAMDERTAADILRTMSPRKARAILERLALADVGEPLAPLSRISDAKKPPSA